MREGFKQDVKELFDRAGIEYQEDVAVGKVDKVTLSSKGRTVELTKDSGKGLRGINRTGSKVVDKETGEVLDRAIQEPEAIMESGNATVYLLCNSIKEGLTQSHWR